MKIFSENFMYRFSYIGIQVHGVNKIHLRVFFRQRLDGLAHLNKSLSKILAPMPCNQHRPLIAVQSADVIPILLECGMNACLQPLIRIDFLQHPVQGINDGVSRHGDLLIRNAFV